MSFKKLCAWAVIIPPVLILIIFIIANRRPATVNFDIFAALFGRAESGLSLTRPLFIWLFLFLALGAVIGFAAQAPRLWRQKGQIKALEQENARLTAEKQAPAPPEGAPNSLKHR